MGSPSRCSIGAWFGLKEMVLLWRVGIILFFMNTNHTLGAVFRLCGKSWYFLVGVLSYFVPSHATLANAFCMSHSFGVLNMVYLILLSSNPYNALMATDLNQLCFLWSSCSAVLCWCNLFRTTSQVWSYRIHPLEKCFLSKRPNRWCEELWRVALIWIKPLLYHELLANLRCGERPFLLTFLALFFALSLFHFLLFSPCGILIFQNPSLYCYFFL